MCALIKLQQSKMSENSQQQKGLQLQSIKKQQKSQWVPPSNNPAQSVIQQNTSNAAPAAGQQSSQISMTIKQQETIQQILHEVLNNSASKANRYGARERNSMHNHYTHNYDYTNFENNYQLDEDIERLLKESELQIEKEYEAMARDQFLRNRLSISINDEQDKLKQIFERMDARSQVSREQNKNTNTQMRKHKNSHHQLHSLSLEPNKRKQSMMSQTSNYSRARKQSTASNDKSEGFGSAFNLDPDKLKLNYPFDDDSFVHSSDGEEAKHLKIKSYTNIPSDFNRDKESNEQSSSDEQSSDQQTDSTNLKSNLIKSDKHKAVAHPQYILDKFEREQINKPKQQTLQILQLDQKYPKINPMLMYRHQYPIFKFKQSSTSKYVRFLKKSMSEINCLVTFMGLNGVKWTILAIEHHMYLFIGEDWKQPIIVNPQRNINNANTLLNPTNKIITSMQLSPQHNFIAVSLGIEILVYQIKKQTNSLVLVKNLNSTDVLNARLIKINKMIFYEENPIKIAYIDNYQNIGLLTVQQIMLFTRIGERSVQHGLDIIMDMDVLIISAADAQENAQKAQQIQNQGKKPSGFSFGKFNQKISNLISKNNTGYLAISSRSQLMVFRIQPNVQLLHTQALREQTTRDISVRWRYNAQNQTKPQLLISYNNKIYIYKLLQNDGSSPESGNHSKQVYLQIHLMYQNHYDITQMEIISNTHLLLHSNQNIIIIAIPLIPSTDLSLTQSSDSEELETRQRRKSVSNHQMFESALIFITSEKQCRVLFTSMDQMIYYSSKEEKLQIATLKTLQEYIDELMLQQGHFREAFTLLMLVHKGVNYSFKFSYTSQALIQCIFAAVQYTIGSLILSMDDSIVQYRLGWVCQLLIETHNENMIWGTVYKKLLEKQKERQREIENKILKIQQQKQEQEKKKHRESYYQVLNNGNQQQSNQKSRVISKNHSFQSLSSEQRKSRFLSHHHFSTILEETTSSQLMPKTPKNLQHILFDILEVFVLKSFITSMPENIFLEFVQYQCEKMSDTILQKVITQNKSPYDGSRLLSLLQHKQRNYLQLFLFSRALICDDPDFYTPFIKVFASFKSQSQKIQKSNSKQNNEALQKMNNIGMMCLWYLRKCLRFQRIPSGIMPLNQKMTIVHSLCAQILQPAFTKKLFAFNGKVFLQTYLLMFLDTEISIMIQQQNQVLTEKYKQFYPQIYQSIMSVPPSPTSMTNRKSVNQSNEEIFDKAFKQLIVLHLQKTVAALKNQGLFWSQFLALAFYYNKVEVCLTFQAVVDVLIVLFQNKFDAYNLYVPPKITTRPSIEQLELSLIQYIKPILLQRKDRFYINKLISFNDKNVSYYLFRIDQNYKQALEHFISSRDSSKLIPFIYELLGDIKEIGKDNPGNHNDKVLRQRKFADLKQILVRNIGLLFKIDKFEALNIFYQIGETSQTIYDLIEENMANKLDFLTAVLKKFQNQDFDIKQRFQLEHLSEVCMLKNKKMLAFLDQFNYPLDQGIVVCQQKGNLLAKAILQQRNGKISDAFMSYERIVKGIIQSNSNGPNSNQKLKSEKQIKRDVRKYTDQCIRICKHYSYDPNAGPENNFWLRIITFINGFIKSNSQHKVFLKVEFQKVLQHILSEMFQFLPTSVLIDFFITKGHRLELSLTKQFSIFQNLFVLARFDINVAKKVLQIFKLDIKDTRKQALIKRKNGIICIGVCDFCKKPLGEETNCNVYSCKHAFHKLCHEDIYRCLTCYYESDNSILSSNIFGTELAKGGMEDSQQPYLKDKSTKKKLNPITNVNIIIQSLQLARQEGIKKKLKVYDFGEEKENQGFYKIIDSYNQKQKQKQKQEKLQEFQNQYLRYTKAKGLEIKQKPIQQEIIVHNVSSYKQ